MGSSKSEENLDRRARVRENQRRSRARKQEYTQELEQKLARHEAAATQNDIQQRIAIQRLQAENEKLRQLLYSLGAQPATVNSYIIENGDPSVSQKVAIPRRMELQSPQESCCTNASPKECQPKPPQQEPQPKPQNTCGIQKEDYKTLATCQRASCDKGSDEDRSDPTDHQPPMITATPPISTAEPSTAADDSSSDPVSSNGPTKEEEPRPPRTSPGVVPECDCTDDDPNSWPEGESRFGTTLCAVAGELLKNYNTLGVDPADIKKRLWGGFRKEMSAGEGCRVQTQLLFEVLNEISGNL
ncbi:hypothetical protein FQN54_003670 [Arachnomyces sp. PD_36]|nr:hypothetical protein FQN54_003670 [Arachnomyces sp. PD_36]